MKQKWLCLIRQHIRRQLVDRMQRECNGDDLVEDDDDGEASRHEKGAGEEFFACDIGMRYPALQVASHREDLHVRIKVSNTFF